MRRRDWNALVAGLGLAAPAALVQAAVYLTEAQARDLLFPGLAMRAEDRTLSPQETRLIESRSGETVRKDPLRILWGPKGQALFIDQVEGKHDLITYALAVAENGKVKGMEILEYRESYGGQVRRPDWRAQFVGKDVHSPLKMGGDIQSISGATISSSHLTGGVRRLLCTYEVLRALH
ncbi:MAG TPA: FMN-binding protein [bacterium]|jgi:hypothetical protein|nr:FMN-binding protein [bacterium]